MSNKLLHRLARQLRLLKPLNFESCDLEPSDEMLVIKARIRRKILLRLRR